MRATRWTRARPGVALFGGRSLVIEIRLKTATRPFLPLLPLPLGGVECLRGGAVVRPKPPWEAILVQGGVTLGLHKVVR